jgi:hypothetical protein
VRQQYEDPYGNPIDDEPTYRPPAPGVLTDVPGHTGPVSPVPPGAPPSPTPPAADPWSTAPTDGNWEAWFRKNLGRDTLTPAELAAMEGSLNKVGVQVLKNAAGVAGKIRLPGGQVVDVIQSAGAGGNRFQWMVGDDSAGGSRAPVDFGSVAIDPSYLAPWTGRAPDGPGEPTFTGPGDFRAPTADSILQDPSYQWRISQGEGALENAAAARGVLNSGGTLSDILNYGQKAASQEYSQIYDRDLSKWSADWNNALTKFQADKNVSDSLYQRAWDKYTDAKNSWYANQSNPFDKLYRVASLGSQAASV